MTRNRLLPHVSRPSIPLSVLAILALAVSTPASAFEPPHLDPDGPVFVAFNQPPTPIELVIPVLPDSLVVDTRGVVLLQVTIDSSGVVTEAEVVRSDTSAIREQAAIAAALASRFVPAKQRDVPVASRIVLPFRFPVRRATQFNVEPVREKSQFGVEVAGRSGCVAQGDTVCMRARFIARWGGTLRAAVDPPAGARVSGSPLGGRPQYFEWTSSGFASWMGRTAVGDTVTISVCTRVEGCGPDSLVAFVRSGARPSPRVSPRSLPLWVEAEGCDCPASEAAIEVLPR